MVAAAQRRRSAALLRFDDTPLARLEQHLSAGGTAGMQGSDIVDGRRFMVSFVGANTNKALHVGHLRNIVLGQALASALTAAGAVVQRHSLVGDIGRRVCEAMVGYRRHHDGHTPETAGLPGDRFVELCSRDCPQERVQPRSAGEPPRESDPNAEEREVRGDSADRLMRSWMLGAPAERALWSLMRGWALQGHRRTLARLGVSIDRHEYESEAIERALALLEQGLRTGLFEREATGGVIYRTGRSEYATMVLQRTDGVLTEYARLLGLYDRILEDLDSDVDFIEVVGIEWQPAATALGEVLAALRRLPCDPCTWAFHGSVTVAGQKMGSSTGEVRWIDDLLDDVAASPHIAVLRELAGGAISCDHLADLVVRATFLCSPTAQPLTFAEARLLAGGSTPGWTIAEAWCRAQRPCESHSNAPVARTAVVQSQLYRRALLRTITRLDASYLASYLLGLCEACLASPQPGPAAAPILRRVLGSLGFLVDERGARDGERPTLDRDLSPAAGVVPHKAMVRAEC